MATILLVEDAQELADVIMRELDGAGYGVLHAADGLSALQVHAAEQPDAIILDWMLPELDGLAVLRQIRQISATPILMLTARNTEDDRVAGLEAGADDYLIKPFSVRELIARIDALLRRSELIRQTLAADRDAPPGVISIDTLMLDPDAYLLTIDGEPVELSRTEFNLLHLMLRNPGRTFSRDYLLDAIWGQDYVTGDRSVDNAVGRLRKKLGPHGDAIKSKWGVGYRWHLD